MKFLMTIFTLILLRKPVTGSKIERRMLNAKPSTLEQFPWQVAIYEDLGNGSKFICGGSLISPQFVLTAAHCLVSGASASSYEMILGATRLDVIEPGINASQVDWVVIHECYNATNFNNDLALFKLSAPVACTKQIVPIQLTKREDTLPSDVDVTVSGWGADTDRDDFDEYTPVDDLRFVQLRTVEYDECVKHFAPDVLLDSVVCVVGTQLKSPCIGDSGGGLVQYVDDTPIHVGVFSFFSEEYHCGAGLPTGFMRTASFLDWIEKITMLEFSKPFCTKK